MQKVIITCHGYTGYPEEVAPIGEFFQARAYSWVNLQLPGHGTSAEDLKQTTWQDWTNYVDSMVEEQLKQFDTVIFAGLSLGGAMTLYALEQFPEIACGLAFAPPYQILTGWQKLLSKLPFINFWINKTEEDARDILHPLDEQHRSYMRHHTKSVRQLNAFVTNVRDSLDKIHQPLLIIQGSYDHVVPPESADKILDKVNSELKERLIVEGSHVLTREEQRDEWFEIAYEFVEKHINHE